MTTEIGGELPRDRWTEFLLQAFERAVAAAQPRACLPPHLPGPTPGTARTIVVGAGKAAHSMAAALEEAWAAKGAAPPTGLVTVPRGTPACTRSIRQLEATHPVPGEASMAAARETLALVSGLAPEDKVICLISGGASSLWALPIPPVTLETKVALTSALLKGGLAIGAMNTVRKCLSRIKGGRLALAAAPAHVTTLAISDVPGDDPAAIGSGPTVGSVATQGEARAILARAGIAVSPDVAAVLADPANACPRPDAPEFARNQVTIIASAATALAAAAEHARSLGVEVIDLGGALEGEARALGQEHARLVMNIRKEKNRIRAPRLILSGGETTVTVTGGGEGGRNGEYLLSLLQSLDQRDGVYALACDTDGIDGASLHAGALFTPETAACVAALGLDAGAFLARNDSHGFFGRAGGLITTGPTGTNVNDFRAILLT